MYKLIDGRDKDFEIEGEKEILSYLGYPDNMDMEEAAEKLEEENAGMDFYHIIQED